MDRLTFSGLPLTPPSRCWRVRSQAWRSGSATLSRAPASTSVATQQNVWPGVGGGDGVGTGRLSRAPPHGRELAPSLPLTAPPACPADPTPLPTGVRLRAGHKAKAAVVVLAAGDVGRSAPLDSVVQRVEQRQAGHRAVGESGGRGARRRVRLAQAGAFGAGGHGCVWCAAAGATWCPRPSRRRLQSCHRPAAAGRASPRLGGWGVGGGQAHIRTAAVQRRRGGAGDAPLALLSLLGSSSTNCSRAAIWMALCGKRAERRAWAGGLRKRRCRLNARGPVMVHTCMCRGRVRRAPARRRSLWLRPAVV